MSVWQLGGGGAGRRYTDLFLDFDVMCSYADGPEPLASSGQYLLR